MLREKDKELLKKLDLTYPALAIKFRFVEPPRFPVTMGLPWLCVNLLSTLKTPENIFT